MSWLWHVCHIGEYIFIMGFIPYQSQKTTHSSSQAPEILKIIHKLHQYIDGGTHKAPTRFHLYRCVNIVYVGKE